MGALLQVILISIGLAMDALSVSIVSGIKTRKVFVRDALRVGLFFGFFQAFMPLIGYFVGSAVEDVVDTWSGPIAFVLLSLVGGKMIYESFQEDSPDVSDVLSTKTLITLGIATSIDALVVGTTLSLIDVPIVVAATMIGVITFFISIAGYMFGSKLGNIFGKRMEIFGGLVLIGIGVSFLL